MFFKGIEKGRGNDTEAGKKNLSIKKNSNQHSSERKKEILNATQ